MPPKVGGQAVLYEGLTQFTPSGSLYIAKSGGLPPYSTTFWRADQPLVLDTIGKRVRYRYPTEDGRAYPHLRRLPRTISNHSSRNVAARFAGASVAA